MRLPAAAVLAAMSGKSSMWNAHPWSDVVGIAQQAAHLLWVLLAAAALINNLQKQESTGTKNNSIVHRCLSAWQLEVGHLAMHSEEEKRGSAINLHSCLCGKLDQGGIYNARERKERHSSQHTTPGNNGSAIIIILGTRWKRRTFRALLSLNKPREWARPGTTACLPAGLNPLRNGMHSLQGPQEGSRYSYATTGKSCTVAQAHSFPLQKRLAVASGQAGCRQLKSSAQLPCQCAPVRSR